MSDYYERIYTRLTLWLAEQYRVDIKEACRIAGICDEIIDPSGRLLGEVRQVSRAVTSDDRHSDAGK
jgi:hypothetical protein